MADRGLRGRGDLARAFEGRAADDLDRIAAALGYAPDESRLPKKLAGGAESGGDEKPSGGDEPTPPPSERPLQATPFLVATRFTRREPAPGFDETLEAIEGDAGATVPWPMRPSGAPAYEPLRSWRSMTALFQQAVSPRQELGRIDVERAVEIIACGEILRRAPMRRVRSRARRIRVVVDRSPHLAPIWADQAQAVRALRAAAPNATIEVVRPHHEVGAFFNVSDVFERPLWPESADEVWVALSDLGGPGSLPTEIRLWTALGRALGPERAIALSPYRVEQHDPQLREIWRIIPWQEKPGFEQTVQDRRETIRALLRALSPALCFSPGLLRAMRLAIAPGSDATIELALWSHPDVEARGDVMRALQPDRARRHLAVFATDPEKPEGQSNAEIAEWREECAKREVDRRASLALIRGFRAEDSPFGFAEDLWFAEALNLPQGMREFLPRSDEVGQAKRYFAVLAAQARRGVPLPLGVRAWLSQLADRAPGARVEPEFRAAIGNALPSELEHVTIRQRGGTLMVSGNEADAAGAIGVLPGVDGLIDVFPAPEAAPFAPWSAREGVDLYGRWAEFDLDGVTQRLRWCPPGSFLMGSPEDEEGRYDDEGPQTEITFEQGFWLFDTAVTQAVYEAVTGENPSRFRGADRPVENVSWKDAQDFIERLNARVPGVDLRLPSEAEWEYACRAGSTTPFEPKVAAAHEGRTVTTGEVNYDGNHPLGEASTGEYREQTVSAKGAPFRPNAWGLWHMHGNVWEWCEDVWTGSHAGASPDGSPRHSSQREAGGTDRVIRGGSWSSDARFCRVAYRLNGQPGSRYDYLGFRPARGQAMSSGRPEGGGAAALEGSRGAASGPLPGAGRVAEPRPEQGDGPRDAQRRESDFSSPLARLRVTPGRSDSVAIPSGPFIIRTDRAELTIQRWTKTDLGWAAGMGRDRFGLWADFAHAGLRQRLRFCPPGRFVMGSPVDEAGYVALKKDFDRAKGREEPQTEITFEQGFWLFDAPVTVRQWRLFMERGHYSMEPGAHGWTGEKWEFDEKLGWADPGFDQEEDAPVTCVGWNDAKAYIDWLSEEVPGLDLRLPSEAEWEYACRAGTLDATWAGPMVIEGVNNAPVLDAIAWYGGNSGLGYENRRGVDSSNWSEKQYDHSKAGTHAVKGKRPNPWGLYDTLGNVFEWCEDVWNDSHEGASPDGSPRPISQQEDGGTDRVIRGGSWGNDARGCRAACRSSGQPDDRSPDLGFRPARGQAMSSGRLVGGGAALLEKSRGAASGPSPGAGRVAEPRPEQGDGPRRAKRGESILNRLTSVFKRDDD